MRPTLFLARFRRLWPGMLVVTLLGRPLGAQSEGASTPAGSTPEVRTAATVTRTLRPDLGIVTMTVAAVGATPLEAGRNVAARVDSVRRAWMALGVPRDSILSRASGWWAPRRIEIDFGAPRFVPYPAEPPGSRGGREVRDTVYRARDALSVRVRDLSKLGGIIDSAYAHGVTDISAVQFFVTSSSRVAAAQAEALAEATEHARRQAIAIAQASGTRLGRVITLSTRDEFSPYGRPYLMEVGVSGASAGSGGGTGPGTEVAPPGIPVTVTIFGRWELQAP